MQMQCNLIHFYLVPVGRSCQYIYRHDLPICTDNLCNFAYAHVFEYDVRNQMGCFKPTETHPIIVGAFILLSLTRMFLPHHHTRVLSS